jgi:hypothetical protein
MRLNLKIRATEKRLTLTGSVTEASVGVCYGNSYNLDLSDPRSYGIMLNALGGSLAYLATFDAPFIGPSLNVGASVGTFAITRNTRTPARPMANQLRSMLLAWGSDVTMEEA